MALCLLHQVGSDLLEMSLMSLLSQDKFQGEFDNLH